MRGLGIDIGTTSICVVLYDESTRRLLKKQCVKHTFLPNSDFMQDPEEITACVLALLEEYKEADIRTIGISSQMHGILYIDKEGQAVSKLYTWKNQTGLAYAAKLQEKTGYPLFTGYGSVTHFGLQKEGCIPETAVSFLGIGDYLALKLTGRKEALVEESMAESFGLYDQTRHCYDREAIRAAGIDDSYYPPTTVGKTAVGSYRSAIVYAAIGDNQAGFYGAVRQKDDSIHINVGTGSQVTVFTKACRREAGLELRSFLGLGYLLVGASLNGGKAYEQLAYFFDEICAGFTGKKVDIYQKMYEITKEKQNTSLTAVPNLYGQRGEQGRVSGFFGLSSENFHPADFIHSFVTGMGRELWEIYQQFPKDMKKGKDKIVVSGNGIRKNTLLQQEIKKMFGFPLVFSDFEEEAAVGACCFVLERGNLCE